MIPTVILISHCLLLSNSELCNLLCQGSVRTMETFAFTGSLFVICLVRPFFHQNVLLSVVLCSLA